MTETIGADPTPQRRRDWIQSYSSKVVTPRALCADQVSFADIPHALAQKVRFNGHLQRMGYSVAQHCVLGAQQIAGPFKLAFLLHEVSEVYLPDVPAPLKPSLFVDLEGGALTLGKGIVKWSQLEALHADAIFTALGLTSIRPLIDSPEVHAMDLRMLMTEKRDLSSPEPEPWGIEVEPLADLLISECWNPARACAEFTDLFNTLTSP